LTLIGYVPVANMLILSLAGTPIDATMTPRFVSHGETFRAVIGDTLLLPCEVDDLGES
jgi:hypothetical protein